MLPREENELLARVGQATPSINMQDRAIQETMGRIVDRSKEHLGPADTAIVQLRRLLRQAVKTAEIGETPAGVRPSYYRLRAAETVVPRAGDWRELVHEGLAQEEILMTV